jgi:hypothetical protein
MFSPSLRAIADLYLSEAEVLYICALVVEFYLDGSVISVKTIMM